MMTPMDPRDRRAAIRRQLAWLSGRPDMAVAVGRRESGFLYRPREIVIDAAHAAALGQYLDEEFGVREFAGDTSHHERKYARSPRAALDAMGLVHLELPDGLDVVRAVEFLRHAGHAQGIRTDVTPNHVYVTDQNRHFWPATLPEPTDAAVSVPEGDAGRGVVVGVLDTGVVRGMVDGRVRPDDNDYDLGVEGDRITNEQGGHGTFVAWQVLRVAPGVTIDPEATCDASGVTNDVEIAADLRELTARARVVNLSLGGYTHDNIAPLALARALAECQARMGDDVVFVASAGNDATSQPSWPAAFKDVVAVAAVDRERRPAYFSNYGSWVDCCALGVDIDDHYVTGTLAVADGSSRRFAGKARWSGTSFAAPRVAGAIAAKLASGATASARVAAAMVLAESRHLADPADRFYGRFVET
jgi:subtilisin family serine protease